MDSSKHIFSADRRDQIIKELKSREFDLVIIGGGITGAGIALDAVTRGMSVALIEKVDFGSGTSGRSTKLIHGGLRYLKNFEFSLVKSVGKERAIVYRNAPHLVVPEKMLLPFFTNGNFNRFTTNVALWVYDRIASVKKKERRIMLSRKETIAKVPIIRSEELKGSGFYSEYRTDDARLTLEIVKTASSYGALCINYVCCTDLAIKGGEVGRVTCRDELYDEQFIVKSKKVVNASGPWVDQVRKIDSSIQGKKMFHTKGVHLVVPRSRLNIEHAIYFDAVDDRMIFVIPRFEKTYLGTTDTVYNGSLEEPEVTVNDVSYLLDSVNAMFPSVRLHADDILSSWSGLRPLIYQEGKVPSSISRKDEIFISDSGLITIAGGKLTGYRLMAKKTVDLVCKQLNLVQECRTDSIRILGGEFKKEGMVRAYIVNLKTRMKSFGLDVNEAEVLVRAFGKQTDTILNKTRAFEKEKLIQALAWFCLRNEQVHTLSDFYIRRLGYLHFYPERIHSTMDQVIPMFAAFLKWDEVRIENEKNEMYGHLRAITQFKDKDAEA